MASLKEIRRRIYSVRNTQKITAAMRMVSVAKMHRTLQNMGTLLPYQERLQEMLGVLLRSGGASVFTQKRELKNLGIILIAPDQGFCGAHNTNLAHLFEAVIGDYKTVSKDRIRVFAIGKKALLMAERKGFTPLRLDQDIDVVSLGSKPQYSRIAAFAKYLMDSFKNGLLDKIEIVYYHYKNQAKQILHLTTWLPIMTHSGRQGFWEEYFADTQGHKEADTDVADGNARNDTAGSAVPDFILEPSRNELLENLLPYVLILKLFVAVLDSNASEYAARSVAMQLATDNASKLLSDLQLQYNKTRQSAITNELLDMASFGGVLNP